jgi:hypothetical protein
MANPDIIQHSMDLAEYFPVEHAGLAQTIIAFPLDLAAMAAQTAVVLNYAFGFRGQILSARFVMTTPSSAGDDAILVPSLDTVVLATDAPAGSGGQLTLTSALCVAGAVLAGQTITGANVFTEHSNFSVTATVAVSQFTAGRGVLEVLVENWDELEVLASLATLASL